MLGLMPTVMKMADGESIFGLKVLSIFNTNVGTPHHTHQGAILLFEGKHGQMQAVVDAFSVTKFVRPPESF
jgi:ornithine cyclodeaminase/alanine dehydrogenase-like protein (mu-crystallin family)